MAKRNEAELLKFKDKYEQERTLVQRRGNTFAVRRLGPTRIQSVNRMLVHYAANSIRDARKAAGMTMLGLAEAAQVKGGKQRVYEIENAMSGGISLGTIYCIAAALGVPPKSLLPDAAEHESE